MRDAEAAYLRPRRGIRVLAIGGPAAEQIYADMGRQLIEQAAGRVTRTTPPPPSYADLARYTQKRIDAYRKHGITWTVAERGQDPETPHVAPDVIEDQFPECVHCGMPLHGCEMCGPADGFIRWPEDGS